MNKGNWIREGGNIISKRRNILSTQHVKFHHQNILIFLSHDRGHERDLLLVKPGEKLQLCWPDRGEGSST